MKKFVLWLCLATIITVSVFEGCKMRRSGTIAKNSAVPANTSNTDSSGTSPSIKLTPSPVPNTRPNPIPNPPPPNPPM
ncbi:hypothetical protein ACFQ3S_02225 [Mucilaginibacter terrae]|uniref:hypothetical protein n=1 Tax=Mucilaginibacter terrae TaxID=1955052 RepID=UPI0036405FCD